MTTSQTPSGEGDPARRVALAVSRWRLPSGSEWSQCKSANRLVQVLASAEARRLGADEALLLNERDEVVEAASANFFWLTRQGLFTSSLDSGALAGVTRAWVFELATRLGHEIRESSLIHGDLATVEGGFLTSSVQEIRGVESLDGRSLPEMPLVTELRRAYQELVAQECASGRH